MITKSEACDIIDRIDTIFENSTKLPYNVEELLKDVHYLFASDLYDNLALIVNEYESVSEDIDQDDDDENDELYVAAKPRRNLVSRNEPVENVESMDTSDLSKKRGKKPNKSITDQFNKLME